MLDNLNKNKISYALLAMSAVILSGCNDGEDKESSPEQSPTASRVSISAQNATFVTEPSSDYIVDLADKVSVGDNKSFSVLSVTSLNDNAECQPIEVFKQGFSISADNVKACDYEYQVQVSEVNSAADNTIAFNLASASADLAPTDTAVARVAVTPQALSESSQVVLSAVSGVTLVEQEVEVNVSQELLYQAGYTVPDGYTLTNNVSLPYSNNTATVNPSSNTISYIPASGFEGIERILFSYQNEASGGVLMGTLDIAVTYRANQGLVVADDIAFGETEINKQVTLDVEPYVSSMDGDDFQLIHVDSFNAAVAPFDPDDVSNKLFTFETAKVGNHYVSFAVSDNNGAYSLGLMEVSAYDPDKVAVWEGILSQGIYFSPPLTTQEAISQGVLYQSSVLDNFYDPAATLALFDFTGAQAYCGVKGRLPSSTEAQELVNRGVQSRDNWPVSEKYIVSDSGFAKTIDLQTGEVVDYTGGNLLVTCIEGGLTVRGPDTEIVADGTVQAEVTFTFLGEDNAPVVGPSISFSVQSESNSANLESLSQPTDENGKAIARVSTIKAEPVTVCGEVGIQNTCTTVNFIGDPATATVVDASYDGYIWETGDTQPASILATVEDVNGNPVKNVTVLLDVTSDAGQKQALKLLDDTVTTDEAGNVIASVVNDEETDEIDEAMVRVSHTNTRLEYSSQDVATYWGNWQWATPLDVRVTQWESGGNVVNFPTISQVNLQCQREFGAGYSLISGALLSEHQDAVSQSSTAAELKLRILGAREGDPITNAFTEASQLGSTILAGRNWPNKVESGETIAGYKAYTFYDDGRDHNEYSRVYFNLGNVSVRVTDDTELVKRNDNIWSELKNVRVQAPMDSSATIGIFGEGDASTSFMRAICVKAK